MYRAYLDESTEGVIFAVGGFFGTAGAWDAMELLWREALPKGIRYFHATDCFGGRGEFRGKPIIERTKLLELLTDLIIEAQLRLICGAVHVPSYSRLAPKRLRNAFFGDKYVAAAEIAVEVACEAIPIRVERSEEPNSNDVLDDKCDFWFERNEYRPSMVEAVFRLRHDSLLSWRHRIGGHADGTKAGMDAIPLLQVGDLGAFLCAKRISEANDSKLPWRTYYEKLEAAGRVFRLRWADERSIKILAALHEEITREAAEGKSYWDDI